MNIENNSYLKSINKDLQEFLSLADGQYYDEYHRMLIYHLGGDEKKKIIDDVNGGKRIRPTLLLLIAEAAGGNWQIAIPAATAVELVHNFSLIHDDIEDDSHYRRGRLTVWKKWGIPQAINAGDAMFALATLAILRMRDIVSPSVVIEATYILNHTCFELTKGQYLDISFERERDVTLDEYMVMIKGKTSALISASCELGALIANAPEEVIGHYKSFGMNLGLAYQIKDDILGIWGDQKSTGKSNMSDLLSKKKSLPIIYGLQHIKEFKDLWEEKNIDGNVAKKLARILEERGAKDFADSKASEYTRNAINDLEKANPQGIAGEELYKLTHYLLDRDK